MKHRIIFTCVIIALVLLFGWLVGGFREFALKGFLTPRAFLAQSTPGPNEALYFVSPSSGTFDVNDTFQVELRIAASASTTSIQAYLDYNPSLIAITNIA